MTGLPDAPLIGPGTEPQLTIDGGAVAHEEVVAEKALEPAAAAGELVDGLVEVGEEAEALEPGVPLARACAGGVEENLYLAGERLAARAASPATRRQYASIYRTLGDWLRGELDRPPTTADLTADAIAAFARHLEMSGGRGGGPDLRAPRASPRPVRSPRRSPPRPSTSSSTTPPPQPACPSGSALRTRCAPTGPPRC